MFRPASRPSNWCHSSPVLKGRGFLARCYKNRNKDSWLIFGEEAGFDRRASRTIPKQPGEAYAATNMRADGLAIRLYLKVAALSQKWIMNQIE